MKKTGLIIQGPLISYGRTGKAISTPLKNLTQSDLVNFNCLENIGNIYKKYSDKLDIVCVVWDSEPPELMAMLLKYIPSNAVVLARDKTPKIKPKSSLIPGNNKYRQFLSSSIGSKWLLERGCDYLIKMRSDQSLNLEALLVDIKKVSVFRDDFLLVPKLDLLGADNLDDFYFAGKTSLLHQLFTTYAQGKDEFFDLVHLDIFYKWASDFGLKPKYSHILRETKFFDLYIDNVWNNLFIPASSLVYESIVWRGEKINENVSNYIFLNDFLNKNFSLLKLMKRRPVIFRLKSIFARIVKRGL